MVRKGLVAAALLAGAALLWTTGCGRDDHHGHDHGQGRPAPQEPAAPDAQPATVQTHCPVMGAPINKDIFVDHEGRRVYFCCPPCVETFKEDPDKYLAKLDEPREEQAAPREGHEGHEHHHAH